MVVVPIWLSVSLLVWRWCSWGWNALMEAAHSGNTPVVKMLLTMKVSRGQPHAWV